MLHCNGIKKVNRAGGRIDASHGKAVKSEACRAGFNLWMLFLPDAKDCWQIE